MGADTVEALSVRDLVRRRVGDAPDIWHLALVQRDLVWDQIRMRYLLDSLLRGYPIGSLLVCQVTGESRVIRLDGGQRAVTGADRDAWQLLDGQQRINALFSLFTAGGRYGRFLLHMTARSDTRGGLATKRRARDESLRYIHWQEECQAEKEVHGRDQHIDLSLWYSWAEHEAERVAEATTALSGGPSETVQILRSIDPQFTELLETSDLETAWRRLRRLMEVWYQPTIPVQYLRLGSPEHMLEVFTRLNRAGVQVAGEDLFFAAVKTRWSDAEQAVSRVEERISRQTGDATPADPLAGC
jgi:hypothetical protein